jgi:hypothetical protein
MTTNVRECSDCGYTAEDGDAITVVCPSCRAPWLDAVDPQECLEWRPVGQWGQNGECSGLVEYRDALSATGRSFPRCDRHWGARLVEQDRITSLYGHPDSDAGPPSDFDPGYAGESW